MSGPGQEQEPPNAPAAPSPRRWPPWSFGSGPRVADLFTRALAAISLVAWLSLGSQLAVLFGGRGLLPIEELIESIRNVPELSFWKVPTVFWWSASDPALRLVAWVGAAVSLSACFGIAPRLCFAVSTALYLSFATVGRDFLSFQWDNLLLECGLLAAFLRLDAPSPLLHFLFRALLFKLYFESGIAKWQSPIGDWHDGSAMTFYYETAPLPTWLAFRAHHLPVWWHHFESRATLVLELAVPFAIFGPRRARLFAATAFTLFQIGNAATANYGFFCYLAIALHVFLLDDVDLQRLAERLGRLAARTPARLKAAGASLAALAGRARAVLSRVRLPRAGPLAPGVGVWAARLGAGLYLATSLASAHAHFGSGTTPGLLAPLLELDHRLRLVNSYHLFASITRERVEPELQTLEDPAQLDAAEAPGWTAHHLRYKPGDPGRAPPFVAPHQPRIDFQLWFYGLSFRRREPRYVSTLLERMCEDPAAVQPLFLAPLPRGPAAVRIAYWQYHFASVEEARATGRWWRRTWLTASRAVPCPRVP